MAMECCINQVIIVSELQKLFGKLINMGHHAVNGYRFWWAGWQMDKAQVFGDRHNRRLLCVMTSCENINEYI